MTNEPSIKDVSADHTPQFVDAAPLQLWPPKSDETSRSAVDELIREGNFILDGITEGDWDFDEWPDKTVISSNAGELIALLPSVLIQERSANNARFIKQARHLLPRFIAELQNLADQVDTEAARVAAGDDALPGAVSDPDTRVLNSLEIEEARDGTVWQSISGAQAQFRENTWWTRSSSRAFWVNYLPLNYIGPGPYTQVQS